MVARADLRVAEERVSQKQNDARVPRDHLPQPIHPSAWGAEERADGPPANQAAHAPLATCNRQRTVPGADRRCRLDPRKAYGSGRSSDSWSLGRRSAERGQEQLYCDTGRTPFTLYHADQGAEQRNGSCGCCLEPACSQAPRYAETLADVGPRTED